LPIADDIYHFLPVEASFPKTDHQAECEALGTSNEKEDFLTDNMSLPKTDYSVNYKPSVARFCLKSQSVRLHSKLVQLLFRLVVLMNILSAI
jgi:hypothetical protein